ncbi:uncharacterized protein A4U43_C03F28650 [Asparagus officinalis]|uniref:Glabrous enhancer-binding protein-like DBD domain-containing protein n=1 Tax=Asparagus officinalis TaxID=4686 RepID=A0A5P1FFJ4_ASPOF|nr:probable transcription factor At1g11510 [Asparagus officinalis]XP_020258548.1 probable transcription factor At1g11510 [Asparagus officinalis]ONK76493.1 uncharacterized protein A4U43_C03F28650 [Asparagus officinalis]
MAIKQPPPPPSPPPSSSEEEEESSSGEDEETITKSPNSQTPTRNQEQEEETDEESESGSSDDEDDDEEDEDPPSDRRPQSISTAASLPLKPFDAGDKSNGKGNANGKALFQRIWSLEDEIAILEGMMEFEPERGPIKLNAAGIRDFHEFVKGSLSLEVSGSQLLEKIKRLKKKYESIAARANNGKAVKFGKPHDKKVYELSMEVWGMGNNNVANDAGGSLKREYPFIKDAMLDVRCCISAELLETLDPEKVRPLEREFKKQKVLEIKNRIRRIDLMKQALQRVLEDVENMADCIWGV